MAYVVVTFAGILIVIVPSLIAIELFASNAYKNRYADLRVAFGNNLPKYYYHYINYGKAEKRVCIGVYTLQNPLTI